MVDGLSEIRMILNKEGQLKMMETSLDIVEHNVEKITRSVQEINSQRIQIVEVDI